jgi:hypothetical protein
VTTIELVNAPLIDDRRPPWVPEEAKRDDITYGLLELYWCMEYNSGPFEFADIDEAHVEMVEKDGDVGTLGDGKWRWHVTLRDGRVFVVTGWHDYTGWDCQSGAEYQEIV